MARSFSGANDEIRFAATAATENLPTGSHTLAIWHRPAVGTTANQALLTLQSSAIVKQSNVNLFNTSPNRVVWQRPGPTNVRPNANQAVVATTAAWYLSVVAITAPGTAVGNWDFSIYQEATGTWLQGVGAGSTGTIALGSAITGGHIAVGESEDLDDFAGHYAVAGLWDVALTEAQARELVANMRTSDWWGNSAGHPVWLVEFNGPVATPIPDLSGNGGDQSAITGTTQDTGTNPAGWTYDGTGATVDPGDWDYGVWNGGAWNVPGALVVSVSRTTSDTVTVSDTATRSGGARPRTTSDTVSVSDAATRLRGGARTTSDSFTVSDSAARVGGRPRTTSDAVSVSDAVARVGARARTTGDTVAVSDVAAGARGVTRSTADSVTVSDVAARGAGARPRSTSDSLAVSDAAGQIGARARVTAETVTVSDTAARVGARARATVDSVAVSDAAVGVAGRSRSTSDAVTVSDAAGRVSGRPRSTSDTVAVSDVAARGALARARTTTDAVGAIADSASGDSHTVAVRSTSDTVTLSDTAARLLVRARQTIDVVAVSDAAARAHPAARTTADTVAVSDAAGRTRAVARVTADAWAVSDTAGRVAVLRTATVDMVDVSDEASGRVLVSVTSSDAWSVSDVATVFRGRPTFEVPVAGYASVGGFGNVATVGPGVVAADGATRPGVAVAGRPRVVAAGARGTIRREL